MDQADDAELLRRYATNRSEEAFVELVRRHLNLVYRSALRQANGDTHRAEDVAQAVFTQLARKAGSLAQHPRLVGWLYTTTHYVSPQQECFLKGPFSNSSSWHRPRLFTRRSACILVYCPRQSGLLLMRVRPQPGSRYRTGAASRVSKRDQV